MPVYRINSTYQYIKHDVAKLLNSILLRQKHYVQVDAQRQSTEI